MSNEPIVLTREDLYQQVWSEPIIHVARRLGLSDRGLGKVCARHRIPVPPRGWWAKKQHGHLVRQPPLPTTDGPGPVRIAFTGAQLPETDGEAPEVQREKSSEWRIEVPEELPISNPLVLSTAAALRRAARDRSRNSRTALWRERYQAQLLKPGPGCLDLAVSKASIPRALRIMQALLAACERRGYVVSVNSSNETIVGVLGEPFQIALLERLKQVRVKRTYGTSVELEPSGCLRLRIGSSYSNSGVHDRPPHLIESALNRFVAGLVRRALDAKRERVIQLEREDRWRAHDDERRRRQQVRESEQLRRRHLRKLAVRWSRQQQLRHFVTAVEQRLSIEKAEPTVLTVAEEWIAWAKLHLQERDAVRAFITGPWPTAPLPEPASVPWSWK